MTLTRGIILPSATAVGGGILANARPLPDGWETGVDFATEACITAGEHVFCSDSPGEKEFQGSDLAEFKAYGVEVSVVCTTLGGERARAEREARAFQALSVIDEYSVGYVLATGNTQAGVDTTNPALADAAASGTGATAPAALALVEDVIAAALHGHLAWIHVAPSTLAELVAASAIHLDDLGSWRSPTGHLIVASPAYGTTIPDEIVATTEVFASVGEIDLIRTVDRTDNRYMAVHEAPALAVFDPCFMASVGIGSP